MWMDGGWMRMMKMTRIAFRLNTTLTKVRELAATTLHAFGIFFFKTLISYFFYPARALRALGLLLADGAPTVGGGKTF